ncbi:MAG: TonB-dependent receptor [Bacteriovoracaceae bacterium]|nr:TonB-dependent receptor [Bacteriovoracaceae bacterium]
MKVSRSFFLLLSITPISLNAQSVDTLAPSAPTSFSSDLNNADAKDESKVVSESVGVHLKDYGGPGKAQTLSIRGAKAADVAVTLEGIRLNSVNSGEFDFGNLSSFGIEEGKIIRGGYAPYSSSPSGQVLLKLPREKIYKVHFDYGSYQNFSLAGQTPNATLSIDQSRNDFPYDDNGITKYRTHNGGQRINLRTWMFKKDHQVWAQLLYSDQDLPGPITFFTDAATQTLTPTLAYQGKHKNYEWAFWGTYEHENYSDHTSESATLNRWWSSGVRGQGRFEIHPKVMLENIFEWTQDLLYSKSKGPDEKFNTPVRHTLSFSESAYMDLTDRWLLHPRVRFEYISDLGQENSSIHPGIGTRYRLSENIDLLGNIAYISRAPNFGEMYFRITGLDLPNPDLKRQASLQGDSGYEIHGKYEKVSTKFQQAVFIDRTKNIIHGVEIPQANGSILYQVQNLGTSLSYGLETSGNFQFERLFKFDANYTLEKSQIADDPATYEPTHRMNMEPTLFPEDRFNFSLPLYMRSAVHISKLKTLSSQWDLGFVVKAQIQRFECKFQLFNLLGWNREELSGFPLSNEPSGKISVEAKF